MSEVPLISTEKQAELLQSSDISKIFALIHIELRMLNKIFAIAEALWYPQWTVFRFF